MHVYINKEMVIINYICDNFFKAIVNKTRMSLNAQTQRITGLKATSIVNSSTSLMPRKNFRVITNPKKDNLSVTGNY